MRFPHKELDDPYSGVACKNHEFLIIHPGLSQDPGFCSNNLWNTQLLGKIAKACKRAGKQGEYYLPILWVVRFLYEEK